MTYKTYNCNTFNVYTLKTDRFKTCHMEIMFSKKINKDTVYEDNFLCDMLCESSKLYNSKELSIHLEELYKTIFYGVTSKTGTYLNTTFILDFINPEYIDEKDYLENVLKLPFDIIQNPNVTNEEFDLNSFNIVKKKIMSDIKATKENPLKMAFQKAMKAMDKDSLTSVQISGSLEDVEKITPASLYQRYTEFFKENTCNIFIVGDVDMDQVVSLIKKYYKNRIIPSNIEGLYVDNKLKSKVLNASDNSEFIQSTLLMVFNLDQLTKKEKDITIHIFNYIFSNGGLKSKLYECLREKNSLCYSVNTMFLKYDNLLVLSVGLDNDNVKKAVSLTKKCLRSMIKGEFSMDDIEDAKNNITLSLDLCLDNSIAIINNYIFNIIDDLPLVDERKKAFQEVTKEDVMNLGKKIKLNTIYTLYGG